MQRNTIRNIFFYSGFTNGRKCNLISVIQTIWIRENALEVANKNKQKNQQTVEVNILKRLVSMNLYIGYHKIYTHIQHIK